VFRVFGHGVDDQHGLFTAGDCRDRLAARRVLLEIPLREGFVIATLTRT
jgi:hypothetical protein